MPLEKWPFWTTLTAALGCGLIAGTFFAFATFVMRALAPLPAPQGIAAMQSINIVVVNSVFMAVFMGSAALSLGALGYGLWQRQAPAAPFLIAGALLYLVGSFGVTIVCNVPLNDALAAVKPASAEGATQWANYLSHWTLWNHVRTLASLGACASFILALCQR